MIQFLTHNVLGGTGEKRGVKSYFVSSQEEFLNGYLDQYVAMRGKDRSQFWFEVFVAWWAKYPWRLPDDTEPPSNDPDKMAELAYTEDEDKKEKAQVEKALCKVSFNRNV